MSDLIDPKKLKPCPFCGGEPHFAGDAGEWQDDSRYVQLTLNCCSVMAAAIGWKRAREMTVPERTAELKNDLVTAWNKREST